MHFTLALVTEEINARGIREVKEKREKEQKLAEEANAVHHHHHSHHNSHPQALLSPGGVSDHSSKLRGSLEDVKDKDAKKKARATAVVAPLKPFKLDEDNNNML